MRNDMYQRGERYASSDMHQVLKINQKGERYASSDIHQVLKIK